LGIEAARYLGLDLGPRHPGKKECGLVLVRRQTLIQLQERHEVRRQAEVARHEQDSNAAHHRSLRPVAGDSRSRLSTARPHGPPGTGALRPPGPETLKKQSDTRLRAANTIRRLYRRAKCSEESTSKRRRDQRAGASRTESRHVDTYGVLANPAGRVPGADGAAGAVEDGLRSEAVRAREPAGGSDQRVSLLRGPA